MLIYKKYAILLININKKRKKIDILPCRTAFFGFAVRQKWGEILIIIIIN
jgi:hypothetical protein